MQSDAEKKLVKKEQTEKREEISKDKGGNPSK